MAGGSFFGMKGTGADIIPACPLYINIGGHNRYYIAALPQSIKKAVRNTQAHSSLYIVSAPGFRYAKLGKAVNRILVRHTGDKVTDPDFLSVLFCNPAVERRHFLRVL